MESPDDLITIQEAADAIDVKPKTIYRYIDRGLLRPYRRRIGRALYVSRAETVALLEPQPLDRATEPGPP